MVTAMILQEIYSTFRETGTVFLLKIALKQKHGLSSFA